MTSSLQERQSHFGIGLFSCEWTSQQLVGAEAEMACLRPKSASMQIARWRGGGVPLKVISLM
jgi:hypothetical protein